MSNINNPQKGSEEPVKVELERINPSITKPVTGKSLLEKESEQPGDFVEGLIPPGFTVLEATSKDGKTRAALNIAAGLTHGNPTFGTLNTKQCRILYLLLSEDTNRFKRRLKSMEGSSVEVNLFNIELITDEPHKGHAFVNRVGAYINRRKYDVVIIDTFRDAIELPKRGNSRHMLEVAAGLRKLANQTQTAIIAVHNSNRESIDENIFQEKSLEAASDNVLLLTSAFREGDREFRTLIHYGRMFPKKEIYLSSPVDGPGFTQIDKLPVPESDLMDKLVLLSHYGLTQKDMADVLNLSQGYVSKLLKDVDPSEFSDDVITHDDIEEFNAPEDEWDSPEDEPSLKKEEDDNLG